MTMTAKKIDNFYDLMDSACDVSAIIEHSKALGHIPLIDRNPRRDKELQEALVLEAKARKTLNWTPAEDIRYFERSTAERTNSRKR